jgi:cytochrome c oxidase subunit 1
MLVYNLFKTHGNDRAESNLEVEYAEPLHSIQRMPPLLNSFGFWVLLVVVYLVASYGYPIAQFFLMDTYGTVPWSI